MVKRRLAAIIVAVALIFSVMPVGTYAASGDTDITSAFTDPNFLAAVQEKIGKNTILLGDVQDITYIYLNSRGISDLSGIEYFTALTYLSCEYNKLRSLDVTALTTLETLYCYGNYFVSETDIIGLNPSQTYFYFGTQNIRPDAPVIVTNTFPISPGSVLTALTDVPNPRFEWYRDGNYYFYDYYSDEYTVTVDDIGKAITVKVSSWDYNGETDMSDPVVPTDDPTLNITSAFTDPKFLAVVRELVGRNTIYTYDVANITWLDLYDMGISDLAGLQYFRSLEFLICANNKLKKLDVRGLTKLQTLYCYGNYFLSEADIVGLNKSQTTDFYFGLQHIPAKAPTIKANTARVTVGTVLIAVTGISNPSVDWYRNGVLVGWNDAYKITVDDIGKSITARVSSPDYMGSTDASSAVVPLPPYNLSDTFKLHSNKNAAKKIYLDFQGSTFNDSHWRKSGKITVPPYSLDSNPSISDIERSAIQYIWQMVAEDFAPFNIDVTTEKPATNNYGARIAIGGNNTLLGKITEGSAGIANLGSFGDTLAVAFVFPENCGSLGYTASAISHEAGHTLRLYHDGQTGGSAEYYSGTNGWGPIMGSTAQTLRQWSRGEYPYANNKEDDLAIIAKAVGYRNDDYGNDRARAQNITGNSIRGIIERNTDIDFFKFYVTNPNVATNINIIPGISADDTNLDVLAKLYDSTGKLIATSNPTASPVTFESLGASFSKKLSAGLYYLSVEGTGYNTGVTGIYSKYGSLGNYTIITANTVAAPVPQSAKPAPATVYVNGKTKTFECYEIRGVTYFKLKDLGTALNGTAKNFAINTQFYVGGVKTLNLVTKTKYNLAVEPLNVKATKNQTATQVMTTIYVDGKASTIKGYFIGNSSYYLIGDLAQCLGFTVTRDKSKATKDQPNGPIVITSK